MSLRRIALTVAAPAVGIAFVVLWVVAEAGRYPNLAVFVLFGLAIALAILTPRIALVVLFVGLSASTVATAMYPTTWLHPWLHPMNATDWPAYAAVLIVPAVVASTAPRLTLRISLIAAILAPIWLAALIASVQEQPWNRGRLIWWVQLPVSVELQAFIAFSVILLASALVLWAAGWGLGGMIRFFRTLLRDPVIRVRINDAFRLGREHDGPALTARERDVLLLVSDGKSNAEIAKALFLSEATVKSHLRSILTKLGLKSRTEIVAHAWRTGMVQAI